MKLKYHVEIMELDDQTIAIPVGEKALGFNGVIKLNETASFILRLLENDVSEETIVDALKKEYEIDSGDVISDVRRIIEELNRRGMLC